jgi:hypothetical protein
MRNTASAIALGTALVMALAAAGCASRQSDAAAYEAWLAPWQGASEEALVARFGKPNSEEPAGPNAKHMTYLITRPPGSGSGATIGISIGCFGIGGGGRPAVGGGVGVTAPLTKGPDTCTTTFLVENGKVQSWVFEGGGCDGPR